MNCPYVPRSGFHHHPGDFGGSPLSERISPAEGLIGLGDAGKCSHLARGVVPVLPVVGACCSRSWPGGRICSAVRGGAPVPSPQGSSRGHSLALSLTMNSAGFPVELLP